MREQLTREQAIALHDTKWWLHHDEKTVSAFQLFNERLAMPFDEFHRCIEVALDRPVFTHEFVDPDSLLAELNGLLPAPSFDEIMAKLPAEKTIVAMPGDASKGEGDGTY